jgi:hypothetical protein
VPRKRSGITRTLKKAGMFKPPKYQHWFTLGEIVELLQKDRDWIRKLEREGRIREPKRVQVGDLSVRLYSPEHLEELREFFKSIQVGRPKEVA